MDFVLYGFVFVIGLCVGSFLNVCAYRLPRAMSLVHPGSHCPHCNEAIAWYDNVPVLSWLSLGGLCRRCGVAFSARYLFVELLTGLLFVWVYAVHRATPAGLPLEHIETLAAYLLLVAALIPASVVDIERMIIPDEISIGGMYVAPVLCAVWPQIIVQDALLTGWLLEMTGTSGSEHLAGLLASVLGMGVGAACIYAAAVFGKMLFRKEAMGFGDVKFMGMIGAFIGWQNVLLAFLAACMLGAVVGIVLLIRRRDTHIPFGPYLAAGAFLVMLYPRQVLYGFLNFPLIIRSWFT
jgi:leader peptidase (prepilin peptidase) / N-methyltransferase